MATRFWDSLSGNWSVGGNWFPALPGSGDVAQINITGSPYTVTYDLSSSTIAGLTLASADATLLWGTNTSLTVTGATSLSSGTIDIVGTGTLDTGSLAVSGGTFLSDGNVSVTGQADFTHGLGHSILGGLFNAGTVSLSNESVITVSSGGTLAAGAGGIHVDGSAEIHLNSPFGALLDSGSIVDNSVISGVGIINGDITGTGTVSANTGTMQISDDISSVGLHFHITDVAASTFFLLGTVAANNTFTFEGAHGFIEENHPGADVFDENIVGMNVGTLAALDPLATNFIKFDGETIAVAGNNTFFGSGGGTVTFTDGSSLDLSAVSGSSSGTWFVNTLTDSGGTSVFLSTVCFAAGTRILTATGERPVETLLQGDIVLTLAGGEVAAQPVKWLGRRRIDLAAHPRPETVAPIRIRRGAFANNMPHTDLLVSPDHAIFVDGKLICARQLVNGSTIYQEAGVTTIDYYHVELDTHAVVLAEGLPTESYLDTGNRGFFANSDAPLTLHPDLTDETDYPTREAASCAPFVWDEGNVKPVWQRLVDRAAALGQPAALPKTTLEPELCIVAKGRKVRPLYAENGLFIFALPKGATEVRLASRASAPSDAKPWLEDRRRLGVYVERILLRGANQAEEIPLDHPNLSRGWWGVELSGSGLRRWTNGNAALPLPASDGPTMLEIQASSGALAYVSDEILAA